MVFNFTLYFVQFFKNKRALSNLLWLTILRFLIWSQEWKSPGRIIKNGIPAGEGETEQFADQVRKPTTPLPCYTYMFTYSRMFVAISGVAYRWRFIPPISMSVFLALHHESSSTHSYRWKDVYCRIVGARKLYPFVIDFKVLTVDIIALFCCNTKLKN